MFKHHKIHLVSERVLILYVLHISSHLQAIHIPWLPLALFGVMALLASIVTLNFPETRGVKLPDTVSEAEHIGKVTKEKKSLAV